MGFVFVFQINFVCVRVYRAVFGNTNVNLDSGFFDCPATFRQRELETLMGPRWSDFNALYKETILRQIAGFHYGLILQEVPAEQAVRLSWRTRNYGNHLSVAEVARRAGFNAGGHRNAGGGSFRGSMTEARSRLLSEFRHSLAGTGNPTKIGLSDT